MIIAKIKQPISTPVNPQSNPTLISRPETKNLAFSSERSKTVLI